VFWGAVQWGFSEVHLVGLANGPDCDLDSSTRDLMASTIVSALNPSSKTGDRLYSGKEIFAEEIGVNPAPIGVSAPVIPKSLPLSGSIFHTSTCNGFVCNYEVTNVNIFGFIQKSRQQAPCGRGKRTETRVRNS